MNQTKNGAGRTRLTRSGYEEYNQRRSRELCHLLETALRDSIPSGYRITTSGPHKISNAVLRLHPTKVATDVMDVHFFYSCGYKYAPETTEFEITRESAWLSLGRMASTAWTSADEYLKEGRMDIQIPVGAPLESYVGQLLAAVASTPAFTAIAARKMPGGRPRDIKLDAFDIVVTLLPEGGTQIASSMHDTGEAEAMTTALNGVELMIQAHAEAGLDINSPAYLQGIETSVEISWSRSPAAVQTPKLESPSPRM